VIIGLVGYALSAAAFAGLLAVLLIGWRRGALARVLLLAVAVSTLWAGLLAWQWAHPVLNPGLLLFVEMLRDGAWIAFLWGVTWQAVRSSDAGSRYLLTVGVVAAGICAAFAVGLLINPSLALDPQTRPLVLIGKLGLTLCVLVLLEHMLRSTSPASRWQIKYLALGLGGVYAFEFYMYAEALMLGGVAEYMLAARGYIHVLMVPLVAVSAARNPRWQLDVFVSRGAVFQGVILMAAGVYLVVMAGAGYYIRVFGGEWGAVLQVVLLFAALILLLSVLFSGRLRARLRVYLSKHFFSYRFDYREEWLRFIATMAAGDTREDLPVRVIRALANILECTAGQIWLRDGGKSYQLSGALNLVGRGLEAVAEDDPLPAYLRDTQWIVDLSEYRRHPDRYPGLVLPEQLAGDDAAWLIVPLFHEQDLLGFVTLGQSLAVSRMTWEERDLLKTAGRQAATHLAQMASSRSLAEARQFEGFNRLSAYVIHDLKNLIAQLSLVVSNARRHGDNPEFLKDAIRTVENAVDRMNRLMQQLRSGEFTPKLQTVELEDLARQVVTGRSTHRPVPKLLAEGGPFPVRAGRDRLFSIINHLVQNAQEATPQDGEVTVRLWQDGRQVHLSVTDTGCGMDEDFIRDRLFRPFDTTKGLTGMGIGAYESRELVRSLGGDVDVRSTPGEGTVIHVRLPHSEEAFPHTQAEAVEGHDMTAQRVDAGPGS
jgi:putative PEP-CTERM system histidine kinase